MLGCKDGQACCDQDAECAGFIWFQADRASPVCGDYWFWSNREGAWLWLPRTYERAVANPASRGLRPVQEEVTAASQWWLVDSGASDHMTAAREDFVTFRAEQGHVAGIDVAVEGRGDARVVTSGGVVMVLRDAYYVPRLATRSGGAPWLNPGCSQREPRLDVTGRTNRALSWRQAVCQAVRE